MRVYHRFLAIAALGAVLALPAAADVRKDNIDVIIAFDKSLSMVDKVNAVKDWVNSSIIDQVLIPGDTLVVIAFYGRADIIISQAIASDSDKATVKQIISRISGNGHFTDIGNALDSVKEEIAKRDSDGREKYVLLLTDGIQEAPPSSKYYSKDGTFNHEFLLNTKTIPEKGWKVMILGLGTGTAARDLAGELKGSYAEVPEEASSTKITANTIAATASTIFSTTTMTEPVRVAPVHKDGSSSISLSLKMSGLQGDTKVVISGVSARFGSRNIPSILKAPVTLTLKSNAVTAAGFPVTFPSDLPPGSQWTTLTFSFASPTTFVPNATVAMVTVNGMLQNNIITLGAGVLILLVLIVVVLVIVWRRTKGRPVLFAIQVDGENVGEETMALKSGRELYLSETAGAFALAARKSPKSLARFSAQEGRLVMTVIKQDRFPRLKDVPPDARGRSFTLRTENGRSLPMKVQSKERK
jgi:hypothetical protein